MLSFITRAGAAFNRGELCLRTSTTSVCLSRSVGESWRVSSRVCVLPWNVRCELLYLWGEVQTEAKFVQLHQPWLDFKERKKVPWQKVVERSLSCSCFKSRGRNQKHGKMFPQLIFWKNHCTNKEWRAPFVVFFFSFLQKSIDSFHSETTFTFTFTW